MKPWKAQSESNDPPSWTQICPSCDNFDPKAFQTLVQQLFFDPHFATFFGVIPITPLFWVIPKPSFFPRTCGLPLGVAPSSSSRTASSKRKSLAEPTILGFMDSSWSYPTYFYVFLFLNSTIGSCIFFVFLQLLKVWEIISGLGTTIHL